jgi:tetratricopeptide (TPR) repeat protein
MLHLDDSVSFLLQFASDGLILASLRRSGSKDMAVTALIASLLMAQAPVEAAPVEVAYNELTSGDTAAAISKIEKDSAEDADHPARLINLGIAYARAGRADDAKAMFNAAVRSEQRYRLETASGDWMDSRDLARRALAMLDKGEFASTQFASR